MRMRRARLWAGLWIAAAALTGCGTIPAEPVAARPDVSFGSHPPAPSPSASPSPVVLGPQCLNPGLEVSVSEVNAALGLRLVGITLRNCGTAGRTLNGYPTIELLDADRKPLDVAVLHGTEQISRIERFAGPPRPVELAPGATAGAALVWRNLTTDAATVAEGAYLRVTPATGQSPHTLTLAVDPGNTGRLAVSPWTALN